MSIQTITTSCGLKVTKVFRERTPVVSSFTPPQDRCGLDKPPKREKLKPLGPPSEPLDLTSFVATLFCDIPVDLRHPDNLDLIEGRMNNATTSSGYKTKPGEVRSLISDFIEGRIDAPKIVKDLNLPSVF